MYFFLSAKQYVLSIYKAGHIRCSCCAGVIAVISGCITAFPFVLAFTYLALTFAYKSEKGMIVRQVNRHLIMADIAADIGIPHQLTLLLMPPVKAVARQIIWNCLWMWDGALGFRAMTDSHGDRPGIWLAKFQTVRYASMLLALQRVNMALQTESAGVSILLQVLHACIPVSYSSFLHSNFLTLEV